MKPVIVITDRDNVATALEALAAGREVEVAGGRILVRETVPSGHKVAVMAIAAGADVIKYGSAIGTATRPIAAGEHVHVHNVQSGRGRGDLPR